MQLSKSNILSVTKPPTLILIALFFNTAIFILIQQLVNNEAGLNINLPDINPVKFIRLEHKPEQPKPEQEIEDIEQEPPPPDIPEPQIEKVQTMKMDLTLPEIDIPLSLSGTPYLGDFAKSTKKGTGKLKIDTNVVPTLKIPPIYPLRAMNRGIEGEVTVEFTIAVDGSVKDPVVVKAKPPNIFDNAVLTSIAKWEFNPDIVDGKPTEKRARQDIKFKLK